MWVLPRPSHLTLRVPRKSYPEEAFNDNVGDRYVNVARLGCFRVQPVALQAKQPKAATRESLYFYQMQFSVAIDRLEKVGRDLYVYMVILSFFQFLPSLSACRMHRPLQTTRFARWRKHHPQSPQVNLPVSGFMTQMKNWASDGSDYAMRHSPKHPCHMTDT